MGLSVIIQGTTGLGKTELIRFLGLLLNQIADPFNETQAEHLFVLRCNGGTSAQQVRSVVERANSSARNAGGRLQSIIFFDELNTAPHISLFKEIIADRRYYGKKIHNNVKIIGAVNPYQLHSEATIARLSQAGLGYWVGDDQLGEKTQFIGKVPLRNLVYRVYPLSDSLKQLVWEFGAIDPIHERKIIKEKLKDFARFGDGLEDHIYGVLTICQDYMRNQCSDEAGFVSLRDVERTCDVLDWLLTKLESSTFNVTEHFATFFLAETFDNQPISFEQYNHIVKPIPIHTQAIVLSIAVTYRSRLTNRVNFDEAVGRVLDLGQHDSPHLARHHPPFSPPPCLSIYHANLVINAFVTRPPPSLPQGAMLSEPQS
jgi:hypothetical protein